MIYYCDWREDPKSKSMESLEYNRVQQQAGKGSSSTFFATSSPKPSRSFLGPQSSSSSESTDNSFRRPFSTAKSGDNKDNQRYGFHRVQSSPILDGMSLSMNDSPEGRPMTIAGIPASEYGVRYIGGYSSSSDTSATPEPVLSPVRIIDYDKSPNSSRRSSEPLEVIRPQPRHGQRSIQYGVNDGDRRAGDYTGDFEEELMYLPQQLQQVTQQIHRQQLSSDSNPEHNTAFLLSYRRSREELDNNSPSNRSPVVSPNTSRRISDPLLNCRISPSTNPSSESSKSKKTAVVSPLLEI